MSPAYRLVIDAFVSFPSFHSANGVSSHPWISNVAFI